MWNIEFSIFFLQTTQSITIGNAYKISQLQTVMLNLAKVKKRTKCGGTRQYVYAWRGGPRLFEREGTEAFRLEYERACADHRRRVTQLSRRTASLYTLKRQSLESFVCSRLFQNSRARAAKKRIDFSIDRDDLRDLITKQEGRCALTNIGFDLIWKFGKGVSTNPFAPSLDRIDSKLGYTRDNIRLVLFSVNAALNEWGYENFLNICEAVVTQDKIRTNLDR